MLIRNEIYNIVSMFQPFDINRRKLRIGPEFDGGYILAEGLESQPVLSFGAGANIDFEIELADKQHKVVIFDHTVSDLPRAHANIQHIKKGLTGKNLTSAIMVDIEEAVDLAGFSGKDDLILKIDIEGSEFEALSCSPKTLRQFEQIAIELHWLWRLTETEFRESVATMMKLLLDDFVVFHAHGNNCGLLRILGGSMTDLGEMGGLPVLDVIELSLIRKDLIIARPNKTTYPTPLDYPNHPGRPDHMMCFFPFTPNSL